MSDDHTAYIGDGVYASFDGYQIWLDTRRQDPVHRIALDPDTFNALIAYAARLRRHLSTESVDGTGDETP